MKKPNQFKVFVVFLLTFVLAFGGMPPTHADTDIVGGASEDISGGASVFVFRKNRKAPHTRKTAQRKFNYSRNQQQKSAQYAKVNSRVREVARNKRKQGNQTGVAANPQIAKNTPPGRRGNTTPPRGGGAAQNNSEALIKQAQDLTAKGDTDAAIEAFRKILKINPRNTVAATGLSDALTAKGDAAADSNNHAAAVSSYEEAVRLDAQNAAAYAGLGGVYDALNQAPQAITNFEKALQLNSELAEIHYPLGVLYFETKADAKSEAALKRVLPARADDAEIRNYLGLIAARNNRDTEAVAAFRMATELKPDYAEAYFNLGEALDRANKADEAIAAYNQALKINPRDSEAWYNLGVAYYNRERYKEAAVAYKQAVAVKNDDVDANLNLADAHRQLQEFDTAVVVYENAIALNKNEPAEERAEVFSKYGYCAGKANQWDKSVAALDESARLNGNDDAVDYANLSWGYNNAAKVDAKAKNEAEAKNKYVEAKKAGQKGTELDPKNEAAQFNLGNAAAQLGEEEVAINAFKTAVSLRSDWAEGYNGLGMAYRMFADFKNAETALSQALRINDNFADAHANMAIALLGLNRKKEAKKHQDRVKQLNPKMALVLDGLMKDITKTLIREGVNKIPGKNKIPGLNRLPF